MKSVKFWAIHGDSSFGPQTDARSKDGSPSTAQAAKKSPGVQESETDVHRNAGDAIANPREQMIKLSYLWQVFSQSPVQTARIRLGCSD
jgi:hypothetical protein